MNALSVRNLVKKYSGRRVIDNLSFDVQQGSSLAIVGKSGSGKSTILNIVGMLESPSAGEVYIDGTKIPKINSGKAAIMRRKKVNYLFQSFALIADESATKNVLIGMQYLKLPKREKLARIEEIFARLELSHVAQDKVTTLSGGEQQRVALARAILKPGNLILADEPTGSLDSALAEAVFDELLHLQNKFGKTLIVVTHDLGIAQRCNSVLNLSNLVGSDSSRVGEKTPA